MKRFFSGVFIVMLVLGTTCLYSKVQVGEEVLERFETQHPYVGKKGVVWEQVFHWPNAGYIAIHFSQFDLANGDRMEISSPDGKFRYMFKDKGKDVYRKKGKKKQISEFWATHIPGDTAVVRLLSKNKKNAFGFVIDKWARGYEKGYIQALLEEEEGAFIEDICRVDNREWAKCYEGTDMYNKARAVCRLLINATDACTGWLLGSEGHVMTTNQCISTQNLAENTDYEFMAEGETCYTDCASSMACGGTVEASSGRLVQTNSSLDYSLILLPSNVTSTYGYLQLRNELPTVGERIYIPQHADGWGKQLTVESDVDDGGYAKIWSTNEPPCTGGPGDIGYYADTGDGGSSMGSPVLAYDDHLVVALDHCGDYCPNRGVPIPNIITDLGANLPNDAIGGSYCESSGDSQEYEWIERVQVGDLDNISGPSPYTDFTSLVVNLEPGTSANLTLTPGFAGSSYPECWNIWIDYNGDKYFDDDDEHVFSGSGTSDVTGSFPVPISASGQTRMRVSMKWSTCAAPCEIFPYGEVEDYTVNFVDYCESYGQYFLWEHIARVQVGDLDNSSGGSNYSYFPLKIANLTKGELVNVCLTPELFEPQYQEYWKIWIDYNQDGDFTDDGEEVFSGYSNLILCGSFTVPDLPGVLTGNTRMRVSMRYLYYPPVCGPFFYGEVEDYTANIQDSP